MHTWENQSYWWTFLTTSSLSLSVRTLTTIGAKAGQTLSARQNLYWVLQQCLQQIDTVTRLDGGRGPQTTRPITPIPSASTVRCHMLQEQVASNLLDLPWSCFRSGLSSFSWNWPFLSHSRSLCILSQGKSHSVWQSVKTTLWSLNFLLDPAWIIIYNKTSGLLSWELCRSNDIILWI